MKTKFFSRFGLSEDNQKNMVVLQEMDEKLFTSLELHFANLDSIRQMNDTEVRKLIKDTDTNPEIITPNFYAFISILRIFSTETFEQPDEFIKDFSEIYPGLVKNLDVLPDRLNRIIKLSKRYKVLFRTRTAKLNGAPLLEDMNASVVIKPVFDESFDFDKMDIKEYTPKRINQVACVLIEFKNSYNDYFTFQVDSNEYEKLLNELIALQIELKSFEDDCK